MDIKPKRSTIERPDDEQIQAIRGREFITPFQTEDKQSLGFYGRKYYHSFALSWIELHSERPYAIGLGARNIPPSIMIADAHSSCHGIHFNTPGGRHYMSGGRQCVINLCDLRDGVSYDMQAGSYNLGRMINVTHRQVASLTERHPDRLESFWQMLEGFDDNRAVDALHTPLQQNCLDAIFSQPVLGNMTEEFIGEQITTFLGTLGTRPLSPAMQKIRYSGNLRSKMEEVKERIDQNPAESFSLRELAFWVGTNENYLKAAFRQLYGMSIFAYIYESRMLISCKLLRDTDMSVDTIAAAVGYPEPQNFYPAFRRRFGITPIAYRMAAGGRRW